MKTIWKYELETEDTQEVTLKKGYEILSLQMQNNTPCIWVLLDPRKEDVVVHLNTYGTGHPVDESTRKEFLGTYQLYSGTLVFHVFQVL